MLINAIQKTPKPGLVGKVKYHGTFLIRQLILKFHDPVIRYRIGGSRLFFPLSSNLPFISHRHPHYAANVGRIAREVQKKYPCLTLIDVGAFIGDTVAMLRQQAQFPILCIEGNKKIFHLLEKNISLFSDVECVNTFLNRQSPQAGSRYWQPVESSIGLYDILKKYPRYARSKMVKVDTDGYDGIILRKASAFLSSVKPILFFEYDPDLLARQGESADSLWAMLNKIGYRLALFYEHTGTYILSANLDQTRLLEELHRWLSGYGGHRYFDVCLFAGEDLDLGETIRLGEMEYFRIRPERMAE